MVDVPLEAVAGAPAAVVVEAAVAAVAEVGAGRNRQPHRSCAYCYFQKKRVCNGGWV